MRLSGLVRRKSDVDWVTKYQQLVVEDEPDRGKIKRVEGYHGEQPEKERNLSLLYRLGWVNKKKKR